MAKSKVHKSQLRKGFTTGAAVAATAKAAWLLLNNSKPQSKIDIIFGDSKRRKLTLNSLALSRAGSAKIAKASIIKDAGDDPDVTNHALISVKIKKGKINEAKNSDHILRIKKCIFIVRGGVGVGIVRRKGLPVLLGKSAINPGPLKMLRKNLAECDFRKSGTFLLEISVKDGEKIAKKTLNPILGIKNGISILGTTGIVVPYSHKAYLDTIKILIKGAKKEGLTHIAFCTGSSTEKAIKKIYPCMKAISIIRIADFIAPSLETADKLKFRKVSVACMQGKLLKYARGDKNTHAHIVKQYLSFFAKIAREKFDLPSVIQEKIKKSSTMNEALSYLPSEKVRPILNELSEIALLNFKNWTKNLNYLEILLFSNDGSLIIRKEIQR